MLRFRIKCSIFMDTEKCRKYTIFDWFAPFPTRALPWTSRGPLRDTTILVYLLSRKSPFAKALQF